MANSKRQGILEYLAGTLLPTITTANGYNFTVSMMDRGLKSTNNLTDADYPALFVASANEARKDITSKDFQSRMTVKIWGIVISVDGTNAQLQLDKLIEDVTKCLYTDPDQGDRVSSTEVKLIETDEGDEVPHAYFRMEVEFLYKAEGTAP